MVDVTQSEWLQEMKAYVERERKKNCREMIICVVVMLAIGFVGFYIAFSEYMLWGIPLGCVMVPSAIVSFLLGIFMGKNVGKALERMIGKSCTDEGKLAEFDREFMDEPQEYIETKTESYIFTEHYMMHLYKDLWELHQSRLLRYSEVSRVRFFSHTKCLFYRENEKNAFLRINFSKRKTGREFVEKLRVMMPGVIFEK